MKGREVLLGAGLGVLSALVLVAILSGVGAPAHRIDLLPTTQNLPAGSGPSSLAVGTSSAIVSPGVQGTATTFVGSGGAGVAGPSLIGTISPLILAAGLGAAFYGFYSRRIDSE
ncbi:MAG: hypothetical protein OK456_04315 [Thaumarchaeota archaeon]|nr:hypothetical protein [Nitrososphaerota archaeon]